MRLFLICPNCGNCDWVRDEVEDGAFKCAVCDEVAYPENMSAKAEEQGD